MPNFSMIGVPQYSLISYHTQTSQLDRLELESFRDLWLSEKSHWSPPMIAKAVAKFIGGMM